MSSIDERVVELQFNNGQFESGVQQSIGTLDRLKKSLNLQVSADSLSGLQKAGKSFDLSNVSNNIQTVADRCSTLGVVGAKALEMMTEKAVNFGHKLLTAIPNQIISGGTARAMKIEAAKFKMEGLLGAEEFEKQWENINSIIDQSVQGTAYGYDAAASVAAQLKASNIDFGDEMLHSLQGIAGGAAMTGSSFEEIGHIFTTIAGQGKVMTEQLNQFANRGLNVAATLADKLHVTEAELRNMVTKGKVSFKQFSEAMYEAFGKQATRANKTFDGAFSNIKASLSRMGAQFAGPAYEAIRKFFVGPDINETTGLLRVLKDLEQILKPLSDQFSVFAENTAASLNKVLDSIHAALEPYAQLGKSVHEAFEKSKKALDVSKEQADTTEKTDILLKKTTKDQDKYQKALKIGTVLTTKSTKEAEGLKKELQALGFAYKDLGNGEIEIVAKESVLNNLWGDMTNTAENVKASISERFPILSNLLGLEKEEAETANATAKEYEGLDELAQDVLLGKYGNGEARKKALEELGLSYAIIQNRVNELCGVEKRHEVTAEDEAKMAKYLSKTNTETAESTEETLTTAERGIIVLGGIGSSLKLVAKIASSLWSNILAPFGKWAGMTVLNGILTILTPIAKKIVALEQSLPDDFFDKKFKGVADFFRNIGKGFEEFLGKARQLESIKALGDSFRALGEAIESFFNSGFEAISGIFDDIGKSAEEGVNFDWLLPIVDALAGTLTSAVDMITAVFTVAGPIIEDFILSIKTLFTTIQGSEATKQLVEAFRNLGTAISGLAQTAFGKITEFFSSFTKEGEESGHMLDWLLPIIDGISNALTWFANKISWVTDTITNFITTKFTSENFTKFKESIEEFIEKAKNSQPVKELMEAFSQLADSIEKLFNPGTSIDDVTRSVSDAGAAAEEAEPKFGWLLKIVEGLAQILTVIVGWADSGIQKLIEFFSNEENAAILEKLGQSFTDLKEAIGGVLDLAFDNVIAFFTGLGKSGEEAKEGTDLSENVSTFERVANAIMFVVDSITELFNLIIANGGNLNAAFTAWFDGVDFTKIWTDFKTNLVSAFASIFGGEDTTDGETAKAGEAVVDATAEAVEEKAKTLPQVIAEKLVGLPGQIAESLKSLIANVDTKNLFEGLKLGGLGIAGIGIGKFFKTVGGAVRNFAKIPKQVVKLMDNLKGVMKAYERDLNANALLKCAFAIGILVASLWGLTQIDPVALGKILGVLTPFLVGIGLLIYAIEKIKAVNKVAQETKGLASAVTPLSQFADAVHGFLGKVALGVNIALIAGGLVLLMNALVKVSEVPWQKMLYAGGVMLVVGGYLLGFIALLKVAIKNVDLSITATLFTLGVAISAFAFAVSILGKMDLIQLGKGVGAVSVFLIALGTAAKIAGKNAADMAKVGSGAALLALGLTLLIVPMLAFSLIPWPLLKRGFVTMMAILISLSLLAAAASPALYELGMGLIALAKSMLTMAAAVVVFAVGIALIGAAVDFFVRCMIDIGKLVTENAGVFLWGFGVMAGVLAAFVMAIIALGPAMELAAIPLKSFGMGLLMVAGAVALFVASFAILSAVFHYFPELGDVISGFVKGALDSLGKLAEKIPIIGDLIKGLFEGEKTTAEFVEEITVGYNLSDEQKEDLATRIDELLNFEGDPHEFEAKLGDLYATVNNFDIPPAEKQQLIWNLYKKFKDKINEGPTATVQINKIIAIIQNLDIPDDKKQELIDRIKRIGSLTPEEAATEVDEIKAEIKKLEAENAISSQDAEDLMKQVDAIASTAAKTRAAEIETVEALVKNVVIKTEDGERELTDEEQSQIQDDVNKIINSKTKEEAWFNFSNLKLHVEELGFDPDTNNKFMTLGRDSADLVYQSFSERMKENQKRQEIAVEQELGETGGFAVSGSTLEDMILAAAGGGSLDALANEVNKALNEGILIDWSNLVWSFQPPSDWDMGINEFHKFLTDNMFLDDEKKTLNIEFFKDLFSGSEYFDDSGFKKSQEEIVEKWSKVGEEGKKAYLKAQELGEEEKTPVAKSLGSWLGKVIKSFFLGDEVQAAESGGAIAGELAEGIVNNETAAETAGETLGNNVVESVNESITQGSSSIAEATSSSIEGATTAAEASGAQLGNSVANAVNAGFSEIGNANPEVAGSVLDSFGSIGEKLLGLFDTSGFDGFVENINRLGQAASDGIGNLRKVIQNALTSQAGESDTNEYTGAIEDTIIKGFESASDAIEAAASGKAFAPGSVLESLFIAKDGDFKAVMDELQKKLESGELDVNEIMAGIIPPGGVSPEELTNYLFPDGMVDPQAMLTLLADSGLYIVQGLETGINENTGLVRTAIDNLANNDVKKVFTGSTGIESPSTVFQDYGRNIDQGLVNGIKNGSVTVSGAIRTMAVQCLNAFLKYLPKFKQAGVKAVNNLRDGLQAGRSVIEGVGKSLGESLVSGINSKQSAAKTAGGDLGQNVVDGVEDKLGTGSGSNNKGYDLGSNFGAAFAAGIASKKQDAYDAAYNNSQAAKEGGADGAGISSPSKVAMKLGGYFGEGFVIGIQKFGDKVYSAAHDMSESAVEALKSPLAIVQDILNGELEVDPTIRPVMDLSEIQNGVGLINGMTPQMSIGVSSISASMNRPKVSPSEEMISELRLLRDNLNQPSNVYNVNGITYDDGSNISDAVRGLIAAARVERRR